MVAKVDEQPAIPHPHSSDARQRSTLQWMTIAIRDTFTRYATRLNRVLARDGSERMEGPLQLAGYTETPDTRPAPVPGGLIYIEDAPGPYLQWSNGSNWFAPGLAVIAQSVVRLDTDFDSPSVGSWGLINAGWVSVVEAGVEGTLPLWDATNQRFDFTALNASPYAALSRIKLNLSIETENTSTTARGCAVGLGTNGNNPDQGSVVSATDMDTIPRRQDFPFTVQSCFTPFINNSGGVLSTAEAWAAVETADVDLLASLSSWFSVEVYA